ncbi:MAG: helix-turn-helix domain-containing protein [Candidatus Omnitrophica bacterium]|nr:helix-turn-helix domain-containing protein [Candidatus Omnitrophota bacterium]
MNPKYWTCGKLAVRFGVSRTQISRDINQLREIGREIQSSQQGYYIFQK